MKTNLLTFREAIHLSLEKILNDQENSIIIGQGVNDPTRIFGTTANFLEKFGPDRLIDMPISEEGMTGFAVGASLGGLYPIQTHIRMDFLIVAMNQLVNTIAKYKYMYGGMFEIPMLIRVIVGRSWGQGPQHSQSLQSIFAHIPGLQVFMPATSSDVIHGYNFIAKNYKGPVISVEHRLLYDFSFVSEKNEQNSFSSYVIKPGEDVTIVASSIMVEESIIASKWLEENLDINIEIINILNITNIDYQVIYSSLKKTKNLIIADTGWIKFGLGPEIIREVIESEQVKLSSSPIALGMAFSPCPTSHALEDYFYPSMRDIVKAVIKQIHGDQKIQVLPSLEFCKHLTKKFKGPF